MFRGASPWFFIIKSWIKDCPSSTGSNSKKGATGNALGPAQTYTGPAKITENAKIIIKLTYFILFYPCFFTNE